MISRILFATVALLAFLPEAAASQSLWDHPLIIDLVHGRPTSADLDHDLPTLRGRIMAEDRDPRWAPRMESALALRLDSDAVLGANHTQHQVRCGATLCEVVIVAEFGSGDEEILTSAFGSFARLAAKELQMDHRTSAYLTVDKAPHRQAALAFFARRHAPAPY